VSVSLYPSRPMIKDPGQKESRYFSAQPVPAVLLAVQFDAELIYVWWKRKMVTYSLYRTYELAIEVDR
jgi:hypothetical protein